MKKRSVGNMAKGDGRQRVACYSVATERTKYAGKRTLNLDPSSARTIPAQNTKPVETIVCAAKSYVCEFCGRKVKVNVAHDCVDASSQRRKSGGFSGSRNGLLTNRLDSHRKDGSVSPPAVPAGERGVKASPSEPSGSPQSPLVRLSILRKFEGERCEGEDGEIMGIKDSLSWFRWRLEKLRENVSKYSEYVEQQPESDGKFHGQLIVSAQLDVIDGLLRELDGGVP